MAAQEEGNREIARELHDVYSQELAAMGMKMAVLKKDSRLGADQVACFSELRQEITELARQIQETSRSLHPSVLEDLGLEAACGRSAKLSIAPLGFRSNSLPTMFPWNPPGDRIVPVPGGAGKPPERPQVCRSDGAGLGLSDWRPERHYTYRQGSGRRIEPSDAVRKGGLGLISMEERVGPWVARSPSRPARSRNHGDRVRSPGRGVAEKPGPGNRGTQKHGAGEDSGVRIKGP